MTKNNPKTILISSLLLLGLAACAEPDTQSGAELPRAKLIEVETPPEVLPELAAEPTAATTPSTVDEIAAASSAVESKRPEFFTELDALPSQDTRNGMPRFISTKFQDPDAGVVIAGRLLSQADADSATRAALADALGRTSGDFGPLTVALLGAEADAAVRRSLTMSLRRATPEAALAGLTLALADADAEVRADAAYCAASHPEVSDLLVPLRKGLTDESPIMRAASARALGVLKDATAADAILGMTADADAEIRLQALRAIKRIDRKLLAQVDLAGLAGDEDPRIAREADKLTRSSN
jgi:hypothetical protein